jgi:outer membrane receptor protein involved in Fe transport
MRHLLPLLLILTAASASAQTGTLSGRIVDAADGQPLPGATVVVEGADVGAASDGVGKFVVRRVPAGPATLVVSFVGYETARVPVTVAAGEGAYVEVELEADLAQLADVVVRSEKFVRNLQETQTSVNVVGEAELEAVPVRDWEDAARLVGNVTTSGAGTFTIRGIPNVGVGNSGGSPTATLYIDGVPQGGFTTSRTARGTWDIEAVEIFRGPQSTVSGRNALSGAVYVRSATPSFDWGAAARVRGGSQDALEGALMVTGPLVDDQLAFRVSAESGTQDTGVDFLNVQSDDDGFRRTNVIAQRNVRARLLATPRALPGLTSLLSYSYAYDRPLAFIGVTDADARTNSENIASFTETMLHNASLETRYELAPSLALTSVTGAVATDYRINQLDYQTSDPDAIIGLGQRSQTDEFNFTQELRLNYETERTQAVAGAFYGWFEFERNRLNQGDIFSFARPLLEGQFRRLGLLPPGAVLPAFEINLTDRNAQLDDNENVAAFGEVNHEIVRGLTLTAGLRYDYETFGGRTTPQTPTIEVAGSPFGPQVDAQVAGLVAAQLADSVQSLDADYHAWLPKLGATLDVTRDASVGFTYQEGYRSGGAAILPVGGVNTFDPEYTRNYELALRSRWLGGRLVANANLFYTDWEDQQVNVPIEGFAGLFRTENAGASTLYGGEVELRAVDARGLTLFSSLGLTHSEFDDFASPTPTDPDRNLEGLAFPGAPGETVAVGAIYDRGTGPFAGLNVSYVGDNYSAVGTIDDADGAPANDPQLRAGDYTLVDGQVGYAFRARGAHARLTVFARNLLDTTARDLAQYDQQQRVVSIVAPPRVLGLSLTVEL